MRRAWAAFKIAECLDKLELSQEARKQYETFLDQYANATADYLQDPRYKPIVSAAYNSLVRLRKHQKDMPFIGIGMRKKETHVVVTRVIEGSPAAEAGIKPGDYVVSVDGQAVSSADDVIEHISHMQIGQELRLVIESDGVTKPYTVQLAPFPERPPLPPEPEADWPNQSPVPPERPDY